MLIITSSGVEWASQRCECGKNGHSRQQFCGYLAPSCGHIREASPLEEDATVVGRPHPDAQSRQINKQNKRRVETHTLSNGDEKTSNTL